MRYWKPRTVPGPCAVSITIASYLNADPRRLHSLACLLESIRAQTYPHWTATIVHDGPYRATTDLCIVHKLIANDDRIRFVQTDQRLGQSGHPHRRKYALQSSGDVLGFCNDDVYYVPVYFEWMLSEMHRTKADLGYCDMVHSHKMWQRFVTAPAAGRIDIGSFLARRKLVEQTSWNNFGFRGDGIYVEAIMALKPNVVHIPHLLYVHN